MLPTWGFPHTDQNTVGQVNGQRVAMQSAHMQMHAGVPLREGQPAVFRVQVVNIPSYLQPEEFRAQFINCDGVLNASVAKDESGCVAVRGAEFFIASHARGG
jgi:hypothetical protein